MDESPRLKIFLDGSCAFCQAVREKVEPRDKRKRLEFADYNDPAVAATAPFPREALDAEMHVRKTDGTWVKGFEAWAAVLRELPGWRWLGWLFGIFPFRQLGPGVYRWIARNRYRIPGFPAFCTTESCALPPAHDVKSTPKETVDSAMIRPQSR